MGNREPLLTLEQRRREDYERGLKNKEEYERRKQERRQEELVAAFAATTHPMQEYESFARLISEGRSSLGLSQIQMAQALGVTQPMISHLEQGRKGPSEEMRSKLAGLLGNIILRYYGEHQKVIIQLHPNTKR